MQVSWKEGVGSAEKRVGLQVHTLSQNHFETAGDENSGTYERPMKVLECACLLPAFFTLFKPFPEAGLGGLSPALSPGPLCQFSLNLRNIESGSTSAHVVGCLRPRGTALEAHRTTVSGPPLRCAPG